MKFVRSISLFVVYPLLLLGVGFLAGMEFSGFRYQDGSDKGGSTLLLGLPSGIGSPAALPQEEAGTEGSPAPEEEKAEPESALSGTGEGDGAWAEPAEGSPDEVMEAASSYETLCVDTAYVLEETDILHHTVVETTQRLPIKYVGMNRGQFIEAMKLYEAFPPLSEMERGFVNLEVLSFSRERVVVQMNYRYVQPSESFYLAVYDNEVVVYLEDRKTVYIETEIELDSLPEQLQRDIIQMMWIENEEKLYDFLENYSS